MKFKVTTTHADEGKAWEWSGTADETVTYIRRAVVDAELSALDPDFPRILSVTIEPEEN